MKERNKIILIVVLAIIAISNMPPISYFFQETYHYQNKDQSFEFVEPGGPTQGFNVAKMKFEQFKLKNPKNPNKQLYRTFRFKPWQFWEWWRMAINYSRYILPYYSKSK